MTLDEFVEAKRILDANKPAGKYVVYMHPAAYSWERWRNRRESGSRICKAQRKARQA